MKKVNCGNASEAFQLTKIMNRCHLKIQNFTKSSKTDFLGHRMPQEVRVRAHDAIRLVTVPVANKQNPDHCPIKPFPAAGCRNMAHLRACRIWS